MSGYLHSSPNTTKIHEETIMFTIFILLKTTNEWLKLKRTDRNQIADQAFAHIFKDESVSLKRRIQLASATV